MNIKQASILLADDEPVLREIMGIWLERVAARVYTAENGEEALNTLSANHVDLIISDVRMPVMDGITLLKKVNGPHMPDIIFITGFSDISAREAYQLGAEAILEKPIERETLLKAAQQSLNSLSELWREPPSGALPQTKLEMRFPSLAAALESGHIAFGRRGFCIRLEEDLCLNLVDFKLEFQADRRIMSGQGMIRWTAPQEHLAGIEILYLDPESRPWVIDLLEGIKSVAFIPHSTAK